jgi:hypothetical protein
VCVNPGPASGQWINYRQSYFIETDFELVRQIYRTGLADIFTEYGIKNIKPTYYLTDHSYTFSIRIDNILKLTRN